MLRVTRDPMNVQGFTFPNSPLPQNGIVDFAALEAEKLHGEKNTRRNEYEEYKEYEEYEECEDFGDPRNPLKTTLSAKSLFR